MKSDNKAIWIKTGYEIFACEGVAGLKVEPLARKVGKSKSSFYHHFADIEIFTDHLLKNHIRQSCIIAEKEQNAKSIEPELIDILVEHKTDLLFNRQLRIHKEKKDYGDTLEQSTKIIGNAFVLLWVKELGLAMTQNQLEGIFTLAIDNFYLQITNENMRPDWLRAYFNKLKKTISGFK
jgi:AcrR family transcriptional regulator